MTLRLVPLVGDPLHQDEALYGFWGRLISTGRDPWLATVPVDKPPLALYLIAGSQSAFGVSEFTMRLPGLAASLLSIPLLYVLARRLYDDGRAGVVAAAVMALTPYPLLFGATAFTDSILIGWWLVACYAAVRGRWGGAGLALGLAFAAKQQAVLLAPLVVGLGLTQYQAKRGGRRAAVARFILALASVTALVWAWDTVRSANGAAKGFWSQGVASYGGLRLIWPAELEPRWHGWARLAGYLFGWPWLGVLLLAGLGALLWRDLAHRRRTRPALADLTLSAFAWCYLFFHWLVAFPVWDRYLLPLVPVAGLLLGRIAVGERQSGTKWRRALRNTQYAILCVLLLGSGLTAVDGQVPVGGDHGAYDGLQAVVNYLRALPVGTVLYDRWLSWHYDFYLFDAHVYRAGFTSPAWLAADAATFYDGRPRYLVVPSWESAARLERTWAEGGMVTSPVLTTHRRDGTTSFVVYEIRR